MKKIFVFVIAIGLLLNSCDNILDIEAEGNPTTTNYFTNDQQAIDAVDRCYSELSSKNSFGRDAFYEQMHAACEVLGGRSNNANLATHNYSGNESWLTRPWEIFYGRMSNANWIIKSLLKKSSLTPVERRSLGEAYFVRGWLHFWIAFRYGLDTQGVPFVRYEDFEGEYDYSIPPQSASVMEDYRMVIEDMDKATEYLPVYTEYASIDLGRVDKIAAIGVKAKVYAYWATWDKSKWNDVIAIVDQLENQYGCGLVENFMDLFTVDMSKWYNKELLWGIPGNGGKSGGGGSIMPAIYLENKGWGIYNGFGQIKPSYDIYEEMAKDNIGDVRNERLRNSIIEYGDEFMFFGEKRRFASDSDIETGFMVGKFMEPFGSADPIGNGYIDADGGNPYIRMNWPMLRFAELMLFRAEAYINTGQAARAANDINRIRKRSNLAELDHTPTMKDIYHERLCELAFEMVPNHLQDLKRWFKSGDAEIKAIAEDELNRKPRVRLYEDRSNPDSKFKIGDYPVALEKRNFQEYMIVYPYPTEQVTKSNGKLKQNPGY